jgi:hypothetical protein
MVSAPPFRLVLQTDLVFRRLSSDFFVCVDSVGAAESGDRGLPELQTRHRRRWWNW